MKAPKTTEMIEHMFASLENPYRQLTPWELDFLERTKDRFDQTGHLTDDQFQKLEQIYAEKTA